MKCFCCAMLQRRGGGGGGWGVGVGCMYSPDGKRSKRDKSAVIGFLLFSSFHFFDLRADLTSWLFGAPLAKALSWIASRGDSQTTHAITLTDSMSPLQKVKSGMGSPDWHVSLFDIHIGKILDMPDKILSWTCRGQRK